MPKLTTDQLKYLQRKLDRAEEATRLTFDKLILAAAKPGELSNALRWESEGLMYNDLLRRELEMVRGLLTDETHPATIQNVTEHYTREVLRWKPEHSTNPCANLEAEMKHRVHQEALELFSSLKD